MLPKGWNIATLGSLATIERGKFSIRPRNDPNYFGGSMPFVQTGDVANAGMFLRSYTQTLNDRGVSVSKVFDVETILLTIAANIGATAITTFPVACPDSVVGIRAYPEKADLFWLKYALICQQKNLDSKAGQNAQKNINLEVLKPLRLKVPPLFEQQRIGRLLVCWDQAIATTEQLIEKSEKQKLFLKAILLSGRRRIGTAIDQWKYVDFDTVFERVKRKNNIGNLNVLTISGERGLISQRDYFKKNIASANLTGYTLVKRGEFAYNKSYSAGYPMGAIKPLLQYDSGVVSSLYLCFRLREDTDGSLDFFRHYFEAGLFNQKIEGIAQEGARNHGLLNVSVPDFFKLKLHIPDGPEQRRIAEIINIAEAEELHYKWQLRTLLIEKQALMQQLLTGKRRVCLPDSETVVSA